MFTPSFCAVYQPSDKRSGSRERERDHRDRGNGSNNNSTSDRTSDGPLWTEHLSSSGKKYYYNKNTEVSQWEKPKEWLEKERLQHREYRDKERDRDRDREGRFSRSCKQLAIQQTKIASSTIA